MPYGSEFLIVLSGNSAPALAAIDKVKSSLLGLNAQSEASGNFLSKTAGLAIKATAVAATFVTVIGLAAVDLAKKYETATTMMQTNADITKAQAKQIADAFLTTAGKVTFSAQEMMDAFSPVAGQLGLINGHALTATQSLSFMNSMMALATATGQSLSATTSSIATVMQAYQIPLAQVTQTTDQLYNAARVTAQPISQIANMAEKLHTNLGPLAPSLKDVSTLLLDLNTHGVTGTRGLMATAGAFNTLLGSGKGATAEIKHLGLTIWDAQGNFVGMQSVLGQLAPHLVGMTEQQRLFAESTLFGSGASKKFDETLMAGLPGWDASASVIDKQGTAAAAAAAHNDDLSAKLDIARKSLTDLGITIGNALLPYMKQLADWFNQHVVPALVQFSGWFTAHLPEIRTAVSEFFGAIFTLAKGVWDFFNAWVIPPLVTVGKWFLDHKQVIVDIGLALAAWWAVDKIKGWVSAASGAISTATGLFQKLFGLGAPGAPGSGGVAGAVGALRGSPGDPMFVFVVNQALGGGGGVMPTRGPNGEVLPPITAAPPMTAAERAAAGLPAEAATAGPGVLAYAKGAVMPAVAGLMGGALGGGAGTGIADALGAKPGSKAEGAGNILGTLGGGAAGGALMGAMGGPLDPITVPIGALIGTVVAGIPLLVQHWGDVTKAVGGVFGTLAGAVGSSGADALGAMTAFFTHPGGFGAFFHDLPGKMAGPFQDAGGAVMAFFTHPGGFGAFFHDLPGRLASPFVDTFGAVTGFFGGIGGWFKNFDPHALGVSLHDDIGHAFTAIGGFFHDLPGHLAGTMATVFQHVVGFFGMLGGWFLSLPGRILGLAGTVWSHIAGFFSMLGGWFASLPGKIAGLVAGVWGHVTGFFGMLGGWFASLPGKIGGFFSGLWGHITGIFTGKGSIGDFFASIPGKIAGFAAGVWSDITGVFGAIGNFFKGIPGHIADFLRNLPIIGGMVGFFTGLFGGKAEGGVIPPGQWELVGENGPELAYGGATGTSILNAAQIAAATSATNAAGAGSGAYAGNTPAPGSIPGTPTTQAAVQTFLQGVGYFFSTTLPSSLSASYATLTDEVKAFLASLGSAVTAAGTAAASAAAAAAGGGGSGGGSGGGGGGGGGGSGGGGGGKPAAKPAAKPPVPLAKTPSYGVGLNTKPAPGFPFGFGVGTSGAVDPSRWASSDIGGAVRNALGYVGTGRAGGVFAAGGIIPPGGSGIVGEHGWELALGGTHGMSIVNQAQLRAGAGGSGGDGIGQVHVYNPSSRLDVVSAINQARWLAINERRGSMPTRWAGEN